MPANKGLHAHALLHAQPCARSALAAISGGDIEREKRTAKRSVRQWVVIRNPLLAAFDEEFPVNDPQPVRGIIAHEFKRVLFSGQAATFNRLSDPPARR